MKTKIKLNSFLKHMPEQLQEGVDEALKQAECDTEHLHIDRAGCETTFKEIQGEERTAILYASTRTLDRDGEIVIPNGMDLTQYQKAPVLLWGHDWSSPPIGHDETIVSDGFGLKSRSIFAKTDFAQDIWSLMLDGHLKTSSIGFVPLDYITQADPRFGKTIDLMVSNWPEFDRTQADQIRGIIPKSILLEHSIVSVPANIDALAVHLSAKSAKVHVHKKTAELIGIDPSLIEEPGQPKPQAPAFEPGMISEDIQQLLDNLHKQPNITSVKPEITKPSIKQIIRVVKMPDAPEQINVDAVIREQLELAQGRI